MNNQTRSEEQKPITPLAAACSALEWAKHTDVTVARMLQLDRYQPLENIIVQLVREKEQCFKRIMALESIAPCKITLPDALPDGKVMVWHCPDELIPDITPNDKLRHGGEQPKTMNNTQDSEQPAIPPLPPATGSAFVVESVAFQGPKSGPDRGYTVRACYLKEPHAGDALVEIFKDGQPLRQFTFPAYKIWNIAAHFKDIVDGEVEKSADGYEMAASDGLGGYAPMTPVKMLNTPGEQRREGPAPTTET